VDQNETLKQINETKNEKIDQEIKSNVNYEISKKFFAKNYNSVKMNYLNLNIIKGSFEIDKDNLNINPYCVIQIGDNIFETNISQYDGLFHVWD